MFPPSWMAESSKAISAFAPSSCRRFVWSPWRSRRHDIIPRDLSLTHCGFCGNIPNWLVHDCVHECSLGEDKSVLVPLLSGPNQTWFSNSGEQDPIQMLVYLSAASLPPSEGSRRSAAFGATGKMNKSCLIQENKSASRYLCWLHLYAHSKFLMWTTGASERIVCIKLEIRDLGIKGRLGVPSCWAHWADVLPSRIRFNLLYIFPLCCKGCELCRDQSLLKVYAGLMSVVKGSWVLNSPKNTAQRSTS